MPSLPTVAWRYWRAGQRLGPPLQVGFAVNNTCNTFCEMCNVWQSKPKAQLSLDEIRQVFGSRLFRHCATISLTGGEPSMRRDFAELPTALATAMPALRQVNLTSNGYATEAIVGGIERFVPALRARGISFGVNLSMDGVGEVHNRVRNNPKAWERLDATVRALDALRGRVPFNLVLACTFTHSNVQDAERVLEYAKEHGIYVIFRRAFTINRIDNADIYAGIEPTPAQDAQIKAFLRRVATTYDRSHARGIYYRMLLAMLDGAERSQPCLYRKAGLFVDHVGDVFVCTVFSKRLGNALREDPESLYFGSQGHREELACGACRRCSHDVSLYTPILHQIGDRVKSAITKVRR
ncbi:MAG TPA: radical SAM protein [Gemmatimonadaceae bacterium]|nr:radical SAM protein [Gemmatimonadaceae bacterium]HRQ78806.1 radical SAM protein [Gemmatimonadaceae bacterium]